MARKGWVFVGLAVIHLGVWRLGVWRMAGLLTLFLTKMPNQVRLRLASRGLKA